jgi:23S rRNA (uracil1939-C5)-methyltransferase
MEITIEKLIYGGEGLAHHEGSTVFVPFVLPTELVDAAPVEQKKKFVRARLERIVTPSAERAAAPCPHFGVCGGCNYQHIPYEAQLRYKTDILRETLRRIGRIDWPGEIITHASPPWAYRNRAQWKVRPLDEAYNGGADGDASAEKLRIGYFRAQSTALCAVDDCAILSPLLLKTLLALRGALEKGELPHELREVEAFSGTADAKLLLTATFSRIPAGTADVAATLRRIVPESESLLFYEPSREKMELFGPGFMECTTASSKYRVGHFSFFQVNRFLIDELVHEVAEKEENGKRVLDLFAGVGLFSVPLAKRFSNVLAVESNPAAARDLEINTAGSSGRGNGTVEVRTADVERFLEKYRDRPELIVLDPPRAGLTPGALKRLGRTSAARMTYISCDPPTLARDLAALVQSGYEISEVRLFDLFPQTFHLETVVRLRRRP